MHSNEDLGTEHQISLAHEMAKFAKASNLGGDARVLIFYDDLALLPALERRYDQVGLMPEEQCRARQSLETKEILIRLRMNLMLMLHFGSDEGVEMAATYHSMISTVQLHGMSSWHYLGELFQKIFNGCRDFFSMIPLNIGLTYYNC